MKTQALLFVIMLTSILGHAQYFNYIGTLTDNSTSYFRYGSEQIYAHDSMFYMIRNGGVQDMNTINRRVKYKWANYYSANVIKPDTGGDFILLKNNNRIYRYSLKRDSLIDISPSISGAYFSDIGTSANKTWAIINNNTLGVYDGQSWSYDSTEVRFGGKLLVENDSVAFLTDKLSQHIICFRHDTFDYSYSLLADTIGSRAWDIDNKGNIWIADSTKLLSIDSSGVVRVIDNLVSQSGSFFTNVFTDDSGNVWSVDNGMALYQFSGGTLTTYNLFDYGYGNINAGIDKQTGIVYALHSDSLYSINRGVLKSWYFGNMPYKNIKAISDYNIATDQGIFSQTFSYYFNSGNAPQYFIDSTVAANPYANDVTCFVVQNAPDVPWSFPPADYGYGTHHGVFRTDSAINNASLPDSNINCIFYNRGNYYIGTNKGLCIYSGGTYTTFDTSNSPLSSNKITCIAVEETYPHITLYIGTDKGMAVYSNSSWKVFNETNVGFNFNVSSICLPFYTNNVIWITTLGSGILELMQDSAIVIYNTTNNGFAEDSVYFATYIEGGDCNYMPAFGTNQHGLAIWQNPGFAYDTTTYYYYENPIIRQYRLFSVAPYGAIFVTDTCLVTDVFCFEGIKTVSQPEASLRWVLNGDKLNIYLPQDYSGNATLTLYDLQGKAIQTVVANVIAGNPIALPADLLACGLYVVQGSLNEQILQTKVVVFK